MQVTVESTGTLERKLRVELPVERIEKEVDTRLKSVGKTAKIKGFRPGKVPPKVVKQRYGKQSDLDKLLAYAKQIGNGALFKKLGFLAEALGFEQTFIDECANNLTTGYAQLDKTATDKSLATKWRLWIPKGYKF